MEACRFAVVSVVQSYVKTATLPDNPASQAVMKRIGLTWRKRAEHRGFSDGVWFDMSRD